MERFARSQRGEEGYFELVEQFSIKAELPELLRLVQENASEAKPAKPSKWSWLWESRRNSSNCFSPYREKADAMVTLIGFVKTLSG